MRVFNLRLCTSSSGVVSQAVEKVTLTALTLKRVSEVHDGTLVSTSLGLDLSRSYKMKVSRAAPARACARARGWGFLASRARRRILKLGSLFGIFCFWKSLEAGNGRPPKLIMLKPSRTIVAESLSKAGTPCTGRTLKSYCKKPESRISTQAPTCQMAPDCPMMPVNVRDGI